MFSEDQVGGTDVSLMEVGSKSKDKSAGEEPSWEGGELAKHNCAFNFGLYLARLPLPNCAFNFGGWLAPTPPSI
jgi:hypothetical protein